MRDDAPVKPSGVSDAPWVRFAKIAMLAAVIQLLAFAAGGSIVDRALRHTHTTHVNA
jgi:hypothetical protein